MHSDFINRERKEPQEVYFECELRGCRNILK